MKKEKFEESRDVSIDRRKYLKLMGALSFGLAAPAIIAKPSESKTIDRLKSASITRPLMGTLVNVTVVDKSKDNAEESATIAFKRMTDLVNIFNRHVDDTPVSWLNKKGVLKDVSPELAEVLLKSFYFNHISKGAFDITVLPLLELYNESFKKNNAPPSYNLVKDNLKLVGLENLKLDKQEIRFLKDGMKISLDGIAKGYIIDQGANLLQKLGVKYALINAGGDIRAIGGNGPAKAWKIGITDPWDRKGKGFTPVLEINNGAVATSGNYENYFDKEQQYHHIINSITGNSPLKTASATAIAPTVMEADALSTSLFILNPKDSIQLTNSLSNVESIIITRSRYSYTSDGFNKLVS